LITPLLKVVKFKLLELNGSPTSIERSVAVLIFEKELFVNTKMDCGVCHKIHSEALKIEFEANITTPEQLYEYDSLIEREFTSRINEINRIIEKARNRLDEEKNEEELNPDLHPDTIKIIAEIQVLSTQAEEAVENGDIDLGQELMEKVDILQRNKNEIISLAYYDVAFNILKCSKSAFVDVFSKNIEEYFLKSFEYNNNFLPSLINLIKILKKKNIKYDYFISKLQNYEVNDYNININNIDETLIEIDFSNHYFFLNENNTINNYQR
jgi:vacuolar-type H+-ATPase subunit I/STV1